MPEGPQRTAMKRNMTHGHCLPSTKFVTALCVQMQISTKNIQIFKALSNKKCQHTQNIEAHKVAYANLFKAISIFISLFAVAVVGRMASNELCSPNLANRNRKFAYSVFWNGSA